MICACELSDSFFEKLQSVVRKPVYRFWNAVPSSSMMCLQATPLPSSLLFGLAPQSVWSLLAVPAQRIFPQPNVWPSRKTMGCPAWLCLQLIPYPCTCTGPRPLVPTALAHDDDAQVVARWANPKKPLGSLSTPSNHASLAVLFSLVYCSRIFFGSESRDFALFR